jgi:competence protein ComEA
MERLKDFFYDNKTIIIITLSLVLLILTNTLQYYYFKNSTKEELTNDISLENTQEQEQEYIYIDIRGEIKKPGVYKISKDKRVIDAITISGGLTNDADTSVNNLSMQLKDEMVIIIYSKQEVKNFIKTKEEEQQKEENCTKEQNNIKNDSCITQDKKENKTTTTTTQEDKTEETKTSKVININTASLEELTTLKGIGEKKAQKIIEYRTKTPFTSKEQIMEVSGIGESIYNKIKDNITT